MTLPLATARAAFERAFGAPPSLACRAPGRVNLIGEHTDYNDGFVLPCAIDFDTVVVGRPRADRQVQVVAADFGDALDRFDLDQPIERRVDAGWANYARGVVKELLARSPYLQGADLAVAGNVPQGAGLSSSASFEVALGSFFEQAQGLGLTPTDIALIGQAAENRFVGMACGIMDQLVSARGVASHALLIDCRSYAAEPVSMPPGIAVLIAHSRVRRGLVESEYNTRRAQCQAAVRHYGVPALRDVSPDQLEARSAGLDPVVLRRARHIVHENLRTVQAAQALREGDLPRMGELMGQSHVSMRDDFEITVPAVDRLAELLQQVIGREGGARMTGGGFGGCVVALLPESRVAQARAAVESQYRSPEGEQAHIYLCHAADGAGASPLNPA